MSAPIPASEPLRPADAARLELSRLAVGPDLSLDQFFRLACEAAAEVLGVERVSIWLFIEQHSAIRCVNLFERSRGAHSEGAVLRVSDFPAYFAALENRRSLPAEVAADDPRTSELSEVYLKPLGITSLLDAGIFRGGELAGIVCHESTGPLREWTTEDRDFASAIGDLIALKLGAAELSETKAALRSHDKSLEELDKADALGKLASSAAHDFRNILSVISAAGQLIVDTAGLPADTVSLATQIIDAAGRGSILVKEMLAFGRQEPSRPQVFDPAALLDALLPMMQTAVGANHKISARANINSRVFVDRSHFERAVLNLVLNARDAMPNGGAISIDLTEEAVQAPEHRGTYIVLAVRDEGRGIDPSVRDRIFEPYVSTKLNGSGSGLGLAIVRRVAEQAGGFASAESAPDRGAIVRIYFPRISRDLVRPA